MERSSCSACRHLADLSQRHFVPVDGVETLDGVDMSGTDAAPLRASTTADIFLVATHDEHHFVVFTHTPLLQVATEKHCEQVHDVTSEGARTLPK